MDRSNSVGYSVPSVGFSVPSDLDTSVGTLVSTVVGVDTIEGSDEEMIVGVMETVSVGTAVGPKVVGSSVADVR